MSDPVVDRSSNKNEQIVHAAEVIGRSKYRRRVFEEIYTGKTKIKTVLDLMAKMKGVPRTRVLDAGKALSTNEIVLQTKSDGVTAYEKIDFFQRYRNKILAAADDLGKRKAIPTKRSHKPATTSVRLSIRIPKGRNLATSLTIDEIDSFKKVRPIPHGLEYIKISETAFKNGTAAILGEKASFKDWGGELRDLSSTHMRVDGKRRMVAIAFKGPGKSGRLTPGKMGKNGDQIQRIVKCPADIFLVQYWRDIDDSVFEQLEKFVQLKAHFENRKLWYGIIDGNDSARLIRAYPSHFPSKFHHAAAK
jgi:hypothetical protein